MLRAVAYAIELIHFIKSVATTRFHERLKITHPMMKCGVHRKHRVETIQKQGRVTSYPFEYPDRAVPGCAKGVWTGSLN